MKPIFLTSSKHCPQLLSAKQKIFSSKLFMCGLPLSFITLEFKLRKCFSECFFYLQQFVEEYLCGLLLTVLSSQGKRAKVLLRKLSLYFPSKCKIQLSPTDRHPNDGSHLFQGRSTPSENIPPGRIKKPFTPHCSCFNRG